MNVTDAIGPIFESLTKLAEFGSVIARTSREDQRLSRLVEFQEAIIRSNSLLVSVQQQNSALLKAKDDLEQQIVRMEQWDDEAARYKLRQVEPGIALHAVTEEKAAGDPPHWLCPCCFAQRKKSIFNRSAAREMMQTTFRCGACGYALVLSSTREPTYA